jgi:hypothetical protein
MGFYYVFAIELYLALKLRLKLKKKIMVHFFAKSLKIHNKKLALIINVSYDVFVLESKSIM